MAIAQSLHLFGLAIVFLTPILEKSHAEPLQTLADTRRPSGVLNICVDEIYFEPIRGRCTKCNRNCSSYSEFPLSWRKRCFMKLSLRFCNQTNRHVRWYIPIEFGEPFNALSKYQHSRKCSSFSISGKLSEKGSFRFYVEATDQPEYKTPKENAAKVSGLVVVSLPLRGTNSGNHGWRNTEVVNRTSGRLRFSYKLNLACSPGFYPANQCNIYTGCIEGQACVAQCSATGIATQCSPSCSNRDGQCVASVAPSVSTGTPKRTATQKNSVLTSSALVTSLSVALSVALMALSAIFVAFVIKRSSVCIRNSRSSRSRKRYAIQYFGLRQVDSFCSDKSDEEMAMVITNDDRAGCESLSTSCTGDYDSLTSDSGQCENTCVEHPRQYALRPPFCSENNIASSGFESHF